MGIKESAEIELFKEISEYPRPSGHLDRIQGFLEGFAAKNGLECSKDMTGNILIRHPGTLKRRFILQAHQDMVPTAADGKDFDFTVQSIQVIEENGWIHADGTTLGADDGSGIAIALCALVSDEMKDYSFNALFTVDEEVSMAGALNIDPSWLDGDYLINIDSEDESQIIIGCAGSSVILCRSEPESADPDGRWFEINVSGLNGGHSALAIDKGRANALRVITDFLCGLDGLKISSFTGGSAHNVIPMKAKAVFSADIPDVIRRFDEYVSKVLDQYDDTEPDMSMEIRPVQMPERSWTSDYSKKLVDSINTCPNGCMEKIGDDIITSSNCGMVYNEGGDVIICIMPRSSRSDALSSLVEKIKSTFSDLGYINIASRYPSWMEDGDSKMICQASDIYDRIFGRRPIVTITHGGLECGVFREKNPDIQMISVGPTIIGAHTPEERMDKTSFSRMKEYVFALIKGLD